MKSDTYQSEFSQQGLHDSWECYPLVMNKFMDWLGEQSVHTFVFGFAWQNDETDLRHLSAFLEPLPESVFSEFMDGAIQPDNSHPVHFVDYPSERRPHVRPNDGCTHSSFFDNLPERRDEGGCIVGWTN